MLSKHVSQDRLMPQRFVETNVRRWIHLKFWRVAFMISSFEQQLNSSVMSFFLYCFYAFCDLYSTADVPISRVVTPAVCNSSCTDTETSVGLVWRRRGTAEGQRTCLQPTISSLTHTHTLFSLLPSHSVALNILQDRVQFKPNWIDECNKNIGTLGSSFFFNTAVLIVRGLQRVCDVTITQILRHVIFISRNNAFIMRFRGYKFLRYQGILATH
jgi:hypothetical protein